MRKAERETRILQAIRAGATRTDAARYGGIGRRTLYDWLGNERFAERVEEAESHAVVAAAGRIGRVEKSLLFNGLLELQSFDAGLDHRDEIVRIDFQNPINLIQGQNNPAADGNTAPDVTMAGPTRSDWDSVTIREAQ